MDIEFSSTKLSLDANPFPALAAMYDQWAELRGQRCAPARAELDPAEMPRHLLPRIAMVDVENDPAGFTYRLCGTAVADVYGCDLTGQSVSALKPECFAEEMWRQYAESVERRDPSLYLYQFPSKSGVWYPHATLNLPFSSDGEKVDLVMSIHEYGAVKQHLKTYFQDTGQTISAPAAL